MNAFACDVPGMTLNCLTATTKTKNSHGEERRQSAMENINKLSPEKPENNSTISENPSDMKSAYSDVSIKELFANGKLQKAIRDCVTVPEVVTVKKLKNPFENKEANTTTQKVEAMSGTTIENAVSLELTLLNTKLDPLEAVNKKYRIVDYTFALEANMSGGRFNGYAAKGLKLMVTKLEEVKGDKK